MVNAFEVGRIVRIARSDILATFRVRAQRPLELDALRGSIVYVMCGDNLLRGDSVLYPALQGL